MSSTVTEATPRKIALWGAVGSGKTALLSALFHEAAGTDLRVLPTEASQGFLRERGHDRAENRFPPPTAVTEPDTAFFFVEAEGVEAELHIHDRAGSHWEKLDPGAHDELRQADGALLLVDPFAELLELEQQLTETLTALFVAQGRVDARPFAVCLSKADALIETPEDLGMAVQQPGEFARRILRKRMPTLEERIARFCARYALFAVSSVGVRLRHGMVESTAFLDERLRWRHGHGGTPVNLAAPFVWLLREIGANDGPR